MDALAPIEQELISRNEWHGDEKTDLFEYTRSVLRQARGKAYSVVNFVMVETYWKIGRRIVEEEQKGKDRASYGTFLIRDLSRRPGDEFSKGLSVANLRNFRQFYLIFPEEDVIRYAVRSELTWTHYRLIMRVSAPAARAYYINEAAEQSWSSRQLERNIASRSYERLLSGPEISAVKKTDRPHSPEEFIKDPYILEFLGLPESINGQEKVLESSIIERLQQFLMELGKGFSFVGRQYRISTETSHFYIDLVFYNYLLKCFVLIDPKTTKLCHQDIGQMDMYVRMFDDLKRGEDDNPTLGIIMRADKEGTVVHYSVLKESQQLFASKYLLVLPSEEELQKELERRHIFAPIGAGN